MKHECKHENFLKRCFSLVAVVFILHTSYFILPAQAQSHLRRSKTRTALPWGHATDTTGIDDSLSIKPDILTLRYKPQVGTLLYDVHTEIAQNVRTDRDELNGVLRSAAQLAFHNVAIDYKKGLWSFDESFTRFFLAGHELSGDSLFLSENDAINRVTRLTYDMTGTELARDVQDTLKLLNAEAQTDAYFFQPPRMLIPLPKYPVTYGDTWKEHHADTISVYDTVNIGKTSGAYIYNVFHTYRLTRLSDTLHRFLAIIVTTDSGTFRGYQTNSMTKVKSTVSGPITGSDTTILDLFTGTVVQRTLSMKIPARVVVSSAEPEQAPRMTDHAPQQPAARPFTDMLTVHSIITLNESNAKLLQKGH